MNRPDDIPEDVWNHAVDLWRDDEFDDGPTIIGRAILAERDRCKLLAYQEKKKHLGNDEACVACLEIALAIVYGQEPSK